MFYHVCVRLGGLLLLCLVTLGSCGESNGKQGKRAETEPTSKHTDAVDLKLPYEPEYFSLDSTVLRIKVFALPALFDLEPLWSRAQMSDPSPRFQFYGFEAVYTLETDNLILRFAEANEVGFVRRYQYMLEATVEEGYTLDCGLTIGDPAESLLGILPSPGNVKQKRINTKKLKVIQFYDQWDIYTHTYRIEDGMIEELVIGF